MLQYNLLNILANDDLMLGYGFILNYSWKWMSDGDIGPGLSSFDDK
jgi:hypothetical protein